MSMAVYSTLTRPYGLLDAVNRMAAATGSPRYAAATSTADYNGHRVGVTFNEFRQYWVAEYTWAGRNVLCRGSLEACLSAALSEHARGALGSQVVCNARTEEEVALCVAKGLLPIKDAEAEDTKWRDARFAEVGWALRTERDTGIPAISLLINSSTVEEYQTKLDEAFAQRRPLQEARS